MNLSQTLSRIYCHCQHREADQRHRSPVCKALIVVFSQFAVFSFFLLFTTTVLLLSKRKSLHGKFRLTGLKFLYKLRNISKHKFC